MMSLDEWRRSVDSFLVSRGRGLRVWQLHPAAVQNAYNSGVFPLSFATQPNLPLAGPPAPPPVVNPGPPPVPPWVTARARQAPQVLNDPNYLLVTGLPVGCPTCGSSNLVDLGKAQGTGLMYFGSLAWVLAASVIDSMVARALSGHCVQCNYCNTTFTL